MSRKTLLSCLCRNSWIGVQRPIWSCRIASEGHRHSMACFMDVTTLSWLLWSRALPFFHEPVNVPWRPCRRNVSLFPVLQSEFSRRQIQHMLLREAISKWSQILPQKCPNHGKIAINRQYVRLKKSKEALYAYVEAWSLEYTITEQDYEYVDFSNRAQYPFRHSRM